MNKFEKGYFIRWSDNTVIITKEFQKKANQMEGEAYELMMKFRGMGLQIVERTIAARKPAKRKAGEPKPFGRPKYSKMEIHIRNMDDADERLPEFELVKKEAKAQRNEYKYVLDWFKSVYPNYNQVPTFTREGNEVYIVNDPNKNEDTKENLAA